MNSAKRAIPQIIGFAGFAIASMAVISFAIHGPFQFLVNVNSPLNAECFAGLLFILLILSRSRFASASPHEIAKNNLLAMPVIAIVVALAYLRTANAPFLHDSYTHVVAAAQRSWRETLQLFYAHPVAGDFFYRPIGFVSLSIDSKWAGYVPARWHVSSMALHAANSAFVYYLVSRLNLGRAACFTAALVFALHGSRPETVSWVAARFDLLAAFFVLLTLIGVCRFAVIGNRPWLIAVFVFALLGLLSKESAFCLPLLSFGLLPFQPAPAERKRTLKASFALVFLTVAVFVYRLWILGDIGGYRSAAGQLTILHFSLLRTAKALLFREWGLLFFPVNWSVQPNALAIAALVLLLFLMVYAAVAWQSDGYRLLTALGWIVAASLPVQHLMLISADLNGSRVFYLPVLGLALFWAVVVQGCERASVQRGFVIALAFCQLMFLDHNLRIWRQVADLSHRTCLAFGRTIASDQRPVLVRNLPIKLRGVFFLRNGFPQCVSINSGVNAQRIRVDDDPQTAPHGRLFVWNDGSEKVEEHTSQ
jgi:hypothetical protein